VSVRFKVTTDEKRITEKLANFGLFYCYALWRKSVSKRRLNIRFLGLAIVNGWSPNQLSRVDQPENLQRKEE